MKKSRKIIKLAGVIALLAAVFFSTSLFAAEKLLTIVHTNDMHSHFQGFSPEIDYQPFIVNADETQGGWSRVATVIQNIKRQKTNPVLVVDAGDHSMGSLFHMRMREEAFELRLLAAMGYDVITLGNHEFDYGLEVLQKVVGLAHFPIISSNYDFSETSLSGMVRPYLILKKGKLRIGVIGINIQPKGLIATDNYKGMKYLDPEETANKLAEQLRREQKCDLVVCLSHLGYGADLRLAESSRNIDLIIGGHSHTYLQEPVERMNRDNKPVLIYQTSGRGATVGRMDITMETTK